VFIDELDALGKARSSGPGSHDERDQTLNQLLVEMDGFDSNLGVIVMAATNRPETLDAALVRPGRFDRNVVVTGLTWEAERRSCACTRSACRWAMSSTCATWPP